MDSVPYSQGRRGCSSPSTRGLQKRVHLTCSQANSGIIYISWGQNSYFYLLLWYWSILIYKTCKTIFQLLGGQAMLWFGAECRLQYEQDGRTFARFSCQGVDFRCRLLLPGLGVLGHGGRFIFDLRVQVLLSDIFQELI